MTLDSRIIKNNIGYSLVLFTLLFFILALPFKNYMLHFLKYTIIVMLLNYCNFVEIKCMKPIKAY